MTVGAFANQTEISASAEDDSVDFGGKTYAGTADVQVGFDTIAPYLGAGLRIGRDEGRFRLLIDVGVLSQGVPQVSASGSVEEPGLGRCGFALSTAGIATLAGALCEAASQQGLELQADLAAEHRELDDDLDSLTLWPVVAVGVAYSF